MSILHPNLDEDFSFFELTAVLKKCKNNKALSPDGISNKFLKNVPPQSEYYLLNLFSGVLRSEKIPNSWSMIDVRMLHEKGDQKDPHNYR